MPRVFTSLIRQAGVAARFFAMPLAVVLCLEVVLQIGWPNYRGDVNDHEFTGGHPVAVNARGYRGPAVPREKAPDELRILALGDSVTFGTAVASEDTWPQQLRHLAAERTGRSVSVINAGFPAADVLALARESRDVWREYRPDVVVLAVTGNMVSLSWIRRDQPDRFRIDREPYTREPGGWARLNIEAKRFSRRLCTPAFLSRESQKWIYALGIRSHRLEAASPYGPRLAQGWAQADIPADMIQGAWEQFERDLVEAIPLLREVAGQVVLVYVPSRYELSEDLRDNPRFIPRQRLRVEADRRVNEICDRLSVPMVPLRGLMRADRAVAERWIDFYVPTDDTHLNPAGHRAVAQSIVPTFVRILP